MDANTNGSKCSKKRRTSWRDVDESSRPRDQIIATTAGRPRTRNDVASLLYARPVAALAVSVALAVARVSSALVSVCLWACFLFCDLKTREQAASSEASTGADDDMRKVGPFPFLRVFYSRHRVIVFVDC